MKIQHLIQSLVAMVLLVLAVHACTGISSQDAREVSVTYGTLQLIQYSDDISGARVIEHVQRLQLLVDDDRQASVETLASELREHIDWDSLSTADQYLLDRLITRVSRSLEDLDLIGEERRFRIHEVLDWVHTAAIISESR